MIDRSHGLPLRRQAAVLRLSRSTLYYEPRPVPSADLAVMRRIDELHLDHPFAGSRMMRDLLRGEGVPKGDALATARIAGIMGAKRTPDLIPLCHPLALSGVKLDLSVADDAVEILATVRTTDRTGVEMEALTAVSVAALTVIDMVKAVDKGAVITDVRVEEKTGGTSGAWSRS